MIDDVMEYIVWGGLATCEPLQHLAQTQGFAILPMPEGDAYPGLSVIPLGDDFTEHAVLAYRQDGMTEELRKFLSLFAGMP